MQLAVLAALICLGLAQAGLRKSKTDEIEIEIAPIQHLAVDPNPCPTSSPTKRPTRFVWCGFALSMYDLYASPHRG
jgi:hypothetical protein